LPESSESARERSGMRLGEARPLDLVGHQSLDLRISLS
jgi:hypothetical protein